MRATAALLLSLSLAFSMSACRRRSYVVERDTTVTRGPAVVSGGGDYAGGDAYAGGGGGSALVATGSFQVLYLPAVSLPIHLVARVHVQTTDGRTFELGPADLSQVTGGRFAVRVPMGVTTGTATVYLNDGRTFTTTFHIAVSSSASPDLGALAPGSDPRCSLPSGTWMGNISSDPNARATAWIEVLGDCHTVRGFMRLETGSGSVDATIEGTWDPQNMVLIAHDTQLFNVQLRPGGGSFCPTGQYSLQLQGGGSTLVGQNTVYEAACAGTSPVYLQRVQ